MQTLSISFLGRDCPGIVANVTQTLSGLNCNITQLTQSILGGEFAGIFIVDVPDNIPMADLKTRLEAKLAEQSLDISVLIRKAEEERWDSRLSPCEPYVVTAEGPDGPGLIAALARVFARHGINIESLKFVTRQDEKVSAFFLFEIEVPADCDVGRLRRELESAARSKNLSVSMQHRDIFEAMHRIADS